MARIGQPQRLHQNAEGGGVEFALLLGHECFMARTLEPCGGDLDQPVGSAKDNAVGARQPALENVASHELRLLLLGTDDHVPDGNGVRGPPLAKGNGFPGVDEPSVVGDEAVRMIHDLRGQR